MRAYWGGPKISDFLFHPLLCFLCPCQGYHNFRLEVSAASTIQLLMSWAGYSQHVVHVPVSYWGRKVKMGLHLKYDYIVVSLTPPAPSSATHLQWPLCFPLVPTYCKGMFARALLSAFADLQVGFMKGCQKHWCIATIFLNRRDAQTITQLMTLQGDLPLYEEYDFTLYCGHFKWDYACWRGWKWWMIPENVMFCVRYEGLS